jgi:hypothetical protein
MNEGPEYLRTMPAASSAEKPNLAVVLFVRQLGYLARLLSLESFTVSSQEWGVMGAAGHDPTTTREVQRRRAATASQQQSCSCVAR